MHIFYIHAHQRPDLCISHTVAAQWYAGIVQHNASGLSRPMTQNSVIKPAPRASSDADNHMANTLIRTTVTVPVSQSS